MKIKIKSETDWEKWRIDTFYDKEPETIAWIESFDGSVFWDIGANIGIYSLYCATVNPGMITYAFEPYRQNFIRLWENIWLNDFDQIWPHFIAISDKNSALNFKQINQIAGASGGKLTGNGNGYRIKTMTGDKLAEIYGYPNYIKIDTDGNELEIILGMPKVLKNRSLKGILVEVNEKEGKIPDLMKKSGFVSDDRFNALKNRESDSNMIFKRG